MLAWFFLKKVIFRFSESGLFFSFCLFFVLTCCKLGFYYFTSFSFKSDNSNLDISVRLYDTRRGRRRRFACRTRRRDVSATKAPDAPAFPAVVAAAASAAASETSRRRRHEGKRLRPPHPKFKPAYFVRVSCRKFKIVVNLDFLGCQLGMNSCGSSRFWNIPAGTDFQKF
jgi:hypothetical protein